MFAGMLARAGLPAIVGPKALVLRFPGHYNHAYEYCRDPGRVQRLETVLGESTGQEWSVRLELDASAPPQENGTAMLTAREREPRALEMPLLNRIVNQLDGRLLKLDEGFGENSPADEPVENTEPAKRLAGQSQASGRVITPPGRSPYVGRTRSDNVQGNGPDHGA